MTDIKHTQDATGGQFELNFEGRNAGKMTYRKESENTITIDHTEVDGELEGKGLGESLVMAAVDYAREKKVKINPQCAFAKHVFDKKTDLNDIRI